MSSLIEHYAKPALRSIDIVGEFTPVVSGATTYPPPSDAEKRQLDWTPLFIGKKTLGHLHIVYCHFFACSTVRETTSFVYKVTNDFKSDVNPNTVAALVPIGLFAIRMKEGVEATLIPRRFVDFEPRELKVATEERRREHEKTLMRPLPTLELTEGTTIGVDDYMRHRNWR